jgi:hypothetical protein
VEGGLGEGAKRNVHVDNYQTGAPISFAREATPGVTE